MNTAMPKLFPLIFLLMILPQSLRAEESADLKRTQIWPDGTRYIGGVVDGKREGKGTIFWQDGTRFVGHFKNDMKNGPGTLLLPDGSIRNAYFENDVRVPSPLSSADPSPESPASPPSTDAMEDADVQGSTNVLANTKVLTGTKVLADTKTQKKIHGADEDEDEDKDKDEKILRQTLDTWAIAWSGQDVDKYLSHYADNFLLPGKISRKKWESQRAQRILKPESIKIKLEYEQVSFLATDLAEVSIQQTYQSNTYSDTSRKVIQLKKIGKDWKILSEKSR